MRPLVLILIVVFTALAAAQTSAPRSFEVASVKVNRTGQPFGMSPTLQPGGRVRAINVLLIDLIRAAYGVEENQIVSAPPVPDVLYDIEARTSPTAAVEDAAEMLRTLLAERFGLKAHRETRPLPAPFLVLATQNPVELEGTYPLPEAQIDRFMLKVIVGYPSKDEEKAIVERMASMHVPTVKRVASPEQVVQARDLLDAVFVDGKILQYVIDLVFATREPAAAGLPALKPQILYGASPRASIALVRAARARAMLEGRGYVTPHDVKSVGFDVLRHRVITTYEAEAEGLTSVDVIRAVFDTVRVP